MAVQEDGDLFWDRLIGRHGGAAQELRDTVRRGENGDAPENERWNLKNLSLALSLDVSMGFSGAMYMSQLVVPTNFTRALEIAPQ